MNCLLVLVFAFSVFCILNSASVSALNPIKSFMKFFSKNSTEVKNVCRGAIIPGTKWCGKGDVAENDNDFGFFRKADICCRNHDKCPDIILARQQKHNLTNDDNYTKLDCDCDREFLECLKTADTFSSRKIGKVYFNLLGTQCFQYGYPNNCVQTKRILWGTKCMAYEIETSREKRYQWMDLPFWGKP